MSEHDAVPPSDRPNVLHLQGELDLGSLDVVESRLENALALGRPLIVDLGDCTFATVDILHLLMGAGRRAREAGTGFVVVVPYSASGVVRRLLFEFAPELVEFAVAPSLSAASALLDRSHVESAAIPVDDVRLQALRASVWEKASRLEELLASRDALVFEKRRAVA